MQSSHSLDVLAVQFDDANLVPNAGLVLPATLAQHLGLEELYRRHVRLGDAPGRPNAGVKAMTSSTRRWQVATASTTPTCCARG